MGVLALQGAFYEHLQLLRKAADLLASSSAHKAFQWDFIEVRTKAQLDACDALILPGGESTTISLVAARSNLLEPLRDFVKYVPPSLPLQQTQWLIKTVDYIANRHGVHAPASFSSPNQPTAQRKEAKNSSVALMCA